MQVTLYTWGSVAAMCLLVAPPSGFKMLCHVQFEHETFLRFTVYDQFDIFQCVVKRSGAHTHTFNLSFV